MFFKFFIPDTMKRILFFLGFAVLSYSALPATVSSSLESVRVFLWGAEINRTATAEVKPGIHEIIFTGLPMDIDPNSVQVKGSGPFTILSVSHRNNFLISPQVSTELKILRDSLEYYTQRFNNRQAMLNVYLEEEALLLANKSMGGEAGVRPAELKNLADFFRSRMTEVKELQLKTRIEIQQLQDRQNRLRQQIARLGSEQNVNVGEVVVTVSATRSARGQFEFSYITRSAGWNAMYDIRAEDTQKPVEMLMKASVRQNTGEDWENIRLTLSTANPLDSRVVPSLSTWFLRYVEPVAQAPYGAAQRSRLKETYMMDFESAPLYIIADDEIVEEALAGSVAGITIATQTHTTREYFIDTPYNIMSGADDQMIEVLRDELPAQFTYFAVPRVERDAFLVARITGWEDFVILPGKMGVFFEDSWVGSTFINPEQTADTLEVSLGTDRSVAVERKRLTEFSRKGVLGRRTTETVAWEIVIRNGKNIPVSIEVKDQIPVSTDGDIQITLEEKSGAIHQESTGILTWRLEIAPGQTVRKPFRYSVRYPSDKKIRLE
ncbi:MAG: mucoidy inhibitor MuiA family protein [Bacteroidetes bacterium]|nr:MAG: mucoidy inhibitor MuiA family protein [Bacteroidota bacterium]